MRCDTFTQTRMSHDTASSSSACHFMTNAAANFEQHIARIDAATAASNPQAFGLPLAQPELVRQTGVCWCANPSADLQQLVARIALIEDTLELLRTEHRRVGSLVEELGVLYEQLADFDSDSDEELDDADSQVSHD